MIRTSLILLLLSGAFNTILAQENSASAHRTNELGIPFIQNFTYQDYDAGPDNWAIVQSESGLMYFGNKEGVLEYDGVSWRLIPLPNQGVVRTMAIDDHDRIYVGGSNDLGYLSPDSVGQLQFVSLRSHLEPEFRDFYEVWGTYTIDGQVYFQTKDYLMRWAHERFTIWRADSTFHWSMVVNGGLMVVAEKSGLLRLKGDSLQHLVPNAKIPSKEIRFLLTYNDSKMLMGTAKSGLFLLDGHTLKPFITRADPFLKENLIYHGIQLSNGWYSIGTMNGGIVVIDHNGSLIQFLNTDRGIIDNEIHYQLEDRQFGLWLSTDLGISRVELLSPYTLFDARAGADGFINSIHRYHDTLYAAGRGILRLETSDNWTKESVFKNISDSQSALCFITVDESMFAGTFSGVYQFINGRAINKFDYRARSLLRSKKNPDRIYLGLLDGLASLKFENGKWQDDGRIHGIEDDILSMVETREGELWLESQVDGVWHVAFPDSTSGKSFYFPGIRHFRANYELPQGLLFLHFLRGEVCFEIEGTVYKYHPELDSIMPDYSFGEPFGLSGKIVPKLEDRHGNIWMWAQIDETDTKHRVVARKQPDNTYKTERIIVDRITQNVKRVLYPEDDSVVWYGGSGGIVRHDLKVAHHHQLNYNALIRKISVDDDSLLFGGATTAHQQPVLPYTSNALRFEYAATSFDEVIANQFQYFLEGFDKDWSTWTSETKKDYTNIPEGSYRFKVRAKNIYDHISAVDEYSFEILPPIYRSWWAYGIYILALVGFVTGLVNWRSRGLQKEKEALQILVAERTEEIRHQALKLEQLDKAKSRFFANISHEFRTPLTLILGPIKEMEAGHYSSDPKPVFSMVRRNTQRLLHLVNQLLDLSKIEAGKMHLQAAEQDVVSFLETLAASYHSLAEHKHIEFEVHADLPQIKLYFDRNKLEDVLHNLLSNAFKFTADGGKVSLMAVTGKSEVEIKVEDSGRGIPEEELPKIFDRFYQVDSSHTHEGEGTGIGLALTKELVELHHGQLSATSIEGQGAAFIVRLPLGKAHLSPDEITQEVPETNISVEPESPLAGSGGEGDQTESNGRLQETLHEPQVLVVEDHPDMRRFIRDILSTGYKVELAADGLEGWEKAIATLPDLILSDVMMPGMDGVELCKKVKDDERTSHIPVILLTAKADKSSKLEGLQTGADDYLAKPFDAEELLLLIGNRIAQRKKLRARFSREVTLQPKDIAITSADERFLEKAIAIVEEHMDDPAFNVKAFVKEMPLGHMQVHRKLEALTDQSPVQFIRYLRLKRAAAKIAQQEDTISQIAYSVGFNNLSYFANCFKQQFGCSPSEYARQETT